MMNFDVVVVGGGLAGAALTVALRASSLRVAVVDAGLPTPSQGWDSRIYAYSPASADFLGTLGVWQHLDADRLCPVHSMDVRGDDGGRLRFDAAGCGLRELAWIGESGLVHRELWESLKRQHNVTVFAPARPTALTISGNDAALELEDGRLLHTRLLVGADGRDSWVRSQTAIKASSVNYEETAVVANFSCERPHRNEALQWFTDEGVVAWLPLPGRMMSLVWSAPAALAETLMAMTPEQFTRRVQERGGAAWGRLSVVTPPAAFPLRFMRLDRVVASRVALIGDAAHAIHPLSGHGINLGFQDARVLSQRLLSAPAWADPGDERLLRSYARERAEEPFLVQYVTHGINRLFAARNPLAAFVRNLGLNLTDRLPVVRSALTRYAVHGKF